MLGPFQVGSACDLCLLKQDNLVGSKLGSGPELPLELPRWEGQKGQHRELHDWMYHRGVFYVNYKTTDTLFFPLTPHNCRKTLQAFVAASDLV